MTAAAFEAHRQRTSPFGAQVPAGAGCELRFTCPNCGGSAEHVTTGRIMGGTEVHAVFRCTSCGPQRAEFTLDVFVRPVVERLEHGELAPCGTQAAYARHQRLGEPVDQACRDAHTRRKHPYGHLPAGSIPSTLDLPIAARHRRVEELLAEEMADA